MLHIIASVPARKIKSVCLGSVIASLLALAILLSPQRALAHTQHAQASDPAFVASIGFAGNLRPGTWVPVQVKLTGGNTDFTGTISIDVPVNSYQTGSSSPTNTYQETIALPAGGQKLITLYVPFPQNTQGSSQTMMVRLLNASGATVSTQIANGQAIASTDVFVGILSDQDRGFGSLTSAQLPAQGSRVDTVTLDASTFPTQAAVLKNFDMLVLDHFTTGSLSHDQLNALQQWVNQGGSLVLAGGPEWQSTLGSLPASLLPVTISGTTTLPANTPLLPLGGPSRGGPNDTADPPTVASPITVSVAKAQAGSVTLLSSGSTPLLVQATKGQGQVYYLAFDPSITPLTTWTGASDLWSGLLYRALGDQLVGLANQGGNPRFSPINNGGIDGTLQSLLPNTFPAIWLVLILLVAYLLIIGPIRLLLVRRLKKRAWSWRIILSSIVVFSLLSYGLVLVQKGTSIISDTVSLIQLGASNGSNTTAHITTMVGVFVPNQGNFRVSIPGSTLAQPGSNPNSFNGLTQQQSDTVTSGADTSQVDLQGVNTWTLRSVSAEQDSQVSGGIASHLSVVDGRLTGTITNTLPYALTDAYVLIGNQILHIDTLAAGQSQQVDLALNDTQNISQQYQPGQQLLVGQIAADKNQQNAPYNYSNQSAQNEDQRHISILSMLSGQGGYAYPICGGGNCVMPAMGGIGMKGTYSSVIMISGSSGGYYRFSGPGGIAQNGHDPLLMSNVPATLIGWTDHAPDASTGVTINGNHVGGLQETLVQAPLSVDFSQGLHVPDTLIPGHIVSASANAGIQSNLPGIYSMQNSGSMTFEYLLPTSLTQQHSTINVNEPSNLAQFGKGVSGNGATDANSLQVHVYNWQTEKWDNFAFAGFTFTIQDTHPYVDAAGRMLLQLENQNSTNIGVPFTTPLIQTV